MVQVQQLCLLAGSFLGATSGPNHRCQEDETKDAKAIEQEQILALMVACPGAPNPSLCGSMGKFTNGMFTY